MGHHRPKTPRLGGKLREIRKRLGLTQNELVSRLGLEHEFDQERISKFERGVLEPPLHVLIAYADVAEITLDVLARSELDLDATTPTSPRRAGSPRTATTKSKKRKPGKKKP